MQAAPAATETPQAEERGVCEEGFQVYGNCSSELKVTSEWAAGMGEGINTATDLGNFIRAHGLRVSGTGLLTSLPATIACLSSDQLTGMLRPDFLSTY